VVAIERDAVEAVAMDMCGPYVRSVNAHLRGAAKKIVFD
jgi:transposase